LHLRYRGISVAAWRYLSDLLRCARMTIRSLGTFRPQIDPAAYVDPEAVVIGKVKISADVSIWPGAVLRGDVERIEVGVGSNVQDLSVIHVDVSKPCIIGKNVGIGHRAVVHACTVGDGVLIGMGAVVLSGVEIGEGAIIGAGAVVKEGTKVPPRTLWVGIPAKQVRELNNEQAQAGAKNAAIYREEYIAKLYRTSEKK